jgi:hypothetical protein
MRCTLPCEHHIFSPLLFHTFVAPLRPQVDDWVVVQDRVLVLARTNFEAQGYAYTLAPASVTHTFHGDFLGVHARAWTSLPSPPPPL